MVVESKELKYPEGVATAEIEKTGMAALGEGKREGIVAVVAAFLGAMAVRILTSGIAVLQETVSIAFRAGNSAFKLGAEISAALVGVGFIIEFNGAALVALGGALAWVVFIPLFTALHPGTGSADEIAEAMWKHHVRYIGVGGMIVGGLWSIFQTRKQLAAGIKSAVAGLGGSGGGPAEAEDVDLPRGAIWGLIVLGSVLAAGVYFANVGIVGALIATVYTLLAVFFFVAISVYIVGLIGSTNQPVSGITIYTLCCSGRILSYEIWGCQEKRL
jgi:putative OPT family oligopeptide transporter